MTTQVLHVYKDCYPVLGGIENHLRLVCGELAKRGDLDVRALVTNLGRETAQVELDGVPFTKAGRLATVASTPISPAMFREMGRFHPDLTHLHFPYPIGELAYLARGRSPHMVITYHSDVIRQRALLALYRPFLWRVLERADRILVSSPNYLATSPYLQRVAAKCSIVPFGILLDRFQQPDPGRVADVRRAYSGHLLLFVGRFRYYKGLHYLIQAMEQVDATLLLIGAGPMESVLRKQVEAAGLKQKVAFLGAVPDQAMVDYYHAADLFVLPSSERSEAFGLAMVEAMACGLPLVSTELGTGTSYVNQHGSTGLVVRPRDPDALAQAIQQLLDDRELRERFGAQSKARACAEFALPQMMERITGIYQEVLASQPAGALAAPRP